ncbi:MAG: GerMN domain-containing protein [Clostridioides sp.]|jgi:hypothetical protein|nr:GerMN domain-containing protein [Clostridioides sp.]
MLRKKFALILSIVSISAFAFGCTSGNNVDKDTEETKTADVSDQITSQDDNQDKSDDASNKDNDKKDSDKDKKETEKPKETPIKTAKAIIVYSFDVDKDALVKNEVEMIDVTYSALFDKLVELKVIPQSSVNSFESKKVDGSTIGYLDVDSAFLKNNYGSDAEGKMLDALAKTFKENLGLDKLKLTVDGKNYGSGHISMEDDEYL